MGPEILFIVLPIFIVACLGYCAVAYHKKYGLSHFFGDAKIEIEEFFALFKREKRPPTPQQTALAVAQLQVAMGTMDAATSSKNPKATLAAGAKALKASRKLDPQAECQLDGRTFNHDLIAAQLLYVEADLHSRDAYNATQAIGVDNYSRSAVRRASKLHTQAIEASTKAIAYVPDNVFFLNQLAEIHRTAGNKRKARKVAKQVLKLDPTNVEALTMLHRL